VVLGERVLRQPLVADPVEPLGGELVERRLGRRLGRLLGLVWAPDAPPNVGEDVRQLLLGLAPIPALRDRSEPHVAPLAVGAEAQREGATGFAVQLDHLSLRLRTHPRPLPSLGHRPQVVLPADRKQRNLGPSIPARLPRPRTPNRRARVSRGSLAGLLQNPLGDLGIERRRGFAPLPSLTAPSSIACA
jgi:hypothetical protein